MARKPVQGDLEQLLRDASKVTPLPLVADDPRLGHFGPQFATMLLARQPNHKEMGGQCKASWLARSPEERICTYYCIYTAGHAGKHRDDENRMFSNHERNDAGKVDPLNPPHHQGPSDA